MHVSVNKASRAGMSDQVLVPLLSGGRVPDREVPVPGAETGTWTDDTFEAYLEANPRLRTWLHTIFNVVAAGVKTLLGDPPLSGSDDSDDHGRAYSDDEQRQALFWRAVFYVAIPGVFPLAHMPVLTQQRTTKQKPAIIPRKDTVINYLAEHASRKHSDLARIISCALSPSYAQGKMDPEVKAIARHWLLDAASRCGELGRLTALDLGIKSPVAWETFEQKPREEAVPAPSSSSAAALSLVPSQVVTASPGRQQRTASPSSSSLMAASLIHSEPGDAQSQVLHPVAAGHVPATASVIITRTVSAGKPASPSTAIAQQKGGGRAAVTRQPQAESAAKRAKTAAASFSTNSSGRGGSGNSSRSGDSSKLPPSSSASGTGSSGSSSGRSGRSSNSSNALSGPPPLLTAKARRSFFFFFCAGAGGSGAVCRQQGARSQGGRAGHQGGRPYHSAPRYEAGTQAAG